MCVCVGSFGGDWIKQQQQKSMSLDWLLSWQLSAFLFLSGRKRRSRFFKYKFVFSVVLELSVGRYICVSFCLSVSMNESVLCNKITK